MQKIINSLATITYSKDFEGIEILFSKAGDLLQYDDTMDLALNMARLNQCNKWLVVKESFKDINIDEFLFFIGNWILNGAKQEAAQHTSTCRIAIVTGVDIRAKINSRFNYLKSTLSAAHIDLKIFDAREDGLQFLTQGFLPLLFDLDTPTLKRDRLEEHNIKEVHH